MSRRKKTVKKPPSTHAGAAGPEGASTDWERYWYGPVAAIRPYLLMKSLLLVLAFDVWLLRIPGGWNYGVDGFNVAHFRWLDVLQPLPTVGFYVGILLAIGILALVCVLIGGGFWIRLLIALLYTYSWAMSMRDNYQHHYFLTLALVAFIFFPQTDARSLYPDDRMPKNPAPKDDAGFNAAAERGAGSWAYVLLAANVAIVYIFTAVNKLEPDWRSGAIVERIASPKQLLDPIQHWFAQIGVPHDLFWEGMAVGIIGLEILIAAGYLIAVRQDQRPNPWVGILCWAAFIAVIAFNGIGNEWIMSLEIGWFSYYMILIACIYFLPAGVLWRIGRVLTWPSRRTISRGSDLLARAAAGPIAAQASVIGGGLAIVVLIIAAGVALELPGAASVASLTATALLGLLVFAGARKAYDSALRCILAAGLANLLLWVTIVHSTVRFYFYNGVAYHMRRDGNVEAAEAADKKALGYLPPGRQDLLEKRGRPEPGME